MPDIIFWCETLALKLSEPCPCPDSPCGLHVSVLPNMTRCAVLQAEAHSVSRASPACRAENEARRQSPAIAQVAAVVI